MTFHRLTAFHRFFQTLFVRRSGDIKAIPRTARAITRGQKLNLYFEKLRHLIDIQVLYSNLFHVTDCCICRILDIGKEKDYYKILNVPEDVSDDNLKKAFRKLALEIHPDKNRADGATEAFKLLNTAYEVDNAEIFSCLT